MGSKLDFDKFYKFKIDLVDGPLAVAPLNYDQISHEEKKKYYMGEFPNCKAVFLAAVGYGVLVYFFWFDVQSPLTYGFFLPSLILLLLVSVIIVKMRSID
jgi:hypothetical protein